MYLCSKLCYILLQAIKFSIYCKNFLSWVSNTKFPEPYDVVTSTNNEGTIEFFKENIFKKFYTIVKSTSKYKNVDDCNIIIVL